MLLVVAGSACVVREDPKEVARCDEVEPAVADTLEASLTDDELRLRRLFQVPSEDREGLIFVSGEIVEADDGPKDEGDIATWSMTGAAGDGLTGVEEHARENSDLPAVDEDTRFIEVDGYITSRGCVDHARPPRPLEMK